MSKPMLTIGMSDRVNKAFKENVALDQVLLVACHDISEALPLIAKESFRLIIYNAAELNSDDVQEMVLRIRRITYAPLVVICAVEALAVTIEVGADVCVPPMVNMHGLFSVALGQARRNECFSKLDDPEPGDPTLYCGDLIIDSRQHIVTQAGNNLRLQPLEFRLIAYMAKNVGLVLSPEQISPAIWLDDCHTSRDVARVIFTLRRKLNDNTQHPKYIETVHGVGYRFLLA